MRRTLVLGLAFVAMGAVLASCSSATCPATCAGVCTVLDDDPANCGACGKRCATGLCSQGQCVASCSAPTQGCSGTCADLQTNPRHCGLCTTSCNGGSCQGGQCNCPSDKASCPVTGTTTNTCADLQSDPHHCGSCANDCGDGFLCQAGTCTCPTTGSVCPGNLCVDVKNDPRHCNGCGLLCAPGEICTNGSCTCRPGMERCVLTGGGAVVCANLNENALHCGACNNGCSTPNEVCVSGQCVPATTQCAPGTQLCSGACVNTHTNASNCGSCGNACTREELCVRRSDNTFDCGRYEPAVGCATCPCAACLNLGRACCPSSTSSGIVYCTADGCPGT